jgi:hypothetical protein
MNRLKIEAKVRRLFNLKYQANAIKTKLNIGQYAEHEFDIYENGKCI